MYHWNGTIAKNSSTAKTRNTGSFRSESARSPSASTTLIGVPLALGGVAGRVNASAPPRAAARAPAAKM